MLLLTIWNKEKHDFNISCSKCNSRFSRCDISLPGISNYTIERFLLSNINNKSNNTCDWKDNNKCHLKNQCFRNNLVHKFSIKISDKFFDYINAMAYKFKFKLYNHIHIFNNKKKAWRSSVVKFLGIKMRNIDYPNSYKAVELAAINVLWKHIWFSGVGQGKLISATNYSPLFPLTQ